MMKNGIYLSPNEIVENVLEYLDNTIYNYAFMIDGSWGVGKTFFVKEKLILAIDECEEKKRSENSEYKKKRILYVSLYGIKDTDEISRLLYLELLRINSTQLTKEKMSDSDNQEKSRISSWIGTGAKILADVVKDSKGIDLEKMLGRISTGFSLENNIFIFDDLERTSCNINDVLGYINNFIEHDGIKVILIANEEEINTVSQLETNPEELMVCLQENLDFDFLDSNEKKRQSVSQNTLPSKDKVSLKKLMERVDVLFARNQSYKQIKEKVVGETVKFQPHYLSMIKQLAENNLQDDEGLKTIILNKAEKIGEIATYYEHFNLRTFLFFLSKMKTIYECLQKYPHIIEKIVDYVFLVSTKFKTGSAIEKWTDSNQYELRPLYGELDFRNQCVAFKFIDEFVLFGKFNSEEILETVSLYDIVDKKKAEDMNDPAYKLQEWWHMEEETVESLMREVLVKLKANEYSFDAYLNILNSFVSLTLIGFDEKLLSELMEYMKYNIQQCQEKIELQRWHATFICNTDREQYALKIKELTEEIEAKNNDQRMEELSNMLSDENTWGTKVGDYVREHTNCADNSFICKINANKILTLIENSNSENIENFRYALGDFYSFSNIADYYRDDYDNLKIIYDGLNPNNSEFDLIKRKNIEWLKDLISQKMELLNPTTVNSSEGELNHNK